MRFERIDLLAYGPFTGRRIEFRPDARLHLIAGPNEAGKSVALAALSDLLFGFPHAKGQDWLHEAAALRLGAEISGAPGRLAFRRRRGRANTLLSDDAGEAPLPDSALAPFLGGVTREVFERAFALDTRRLHAGAADMLAAEGGPGGALFAAAAGVPGLEAARRALEAEAEAIFTPRRSAARRFYQILDRHAEAAKAERAAELGARAWAELVEAEARAAAEVEALGHRRRAAQAARERLLRLLQLRPLVLEAEARAAEAAEFAGLEAPPEGAGEELATALAEREQALRAAADLAREEAERRAEAAGITPDAALLAAGEAVDALFARLGRYQKDLADLPRLRAERDQAARRLEELAARLGLAGAGELRAARPTDAAMQALEALIAEAATHQAAVEEQKRRLARAEAVLSSAPEGAEAPPPDPAPWRRALEALGPDLDRLAAAEGVRAERAQAAEALARRLAALEPPLPDPSRLRGAALPSRELQRTLAERRRAAAAALAEAEAEARALARRREAAEAALAALARAGPVPTRAAILAARAARDSALAEAAAAAAGGGDAAGALARLPPLVAEADRLADAALTDAERVARHGAAEAELALLAPAEAAAAERREAAARALAALDSDWAARLAPLGVAPQPPETMDGWIADAEAAAEAMARLAALEAREAEAEALRAALRPALEALAAATGGVEAAPALPPAALARAIGQALAALEQVHADWRAAEAARAGARRERAQAEAALARARAAAADWEGRYAAALAAAGLDRALPPAAARAALEAWREVSPALERHAEGERRAAGLERDIAAFETEARALAARLAPELAALAAGTIAEALTERLRAARADAVRRDAALREAEARARRRAAAEAAAADAGARITRAMEGLPPGLDPAAAAAALRARDAARAEAARARARLAEAAAGEDPAALRAALEGFDPDAAAVEAEELRIEAERLAAESNAAAARAAEARRAREARETAAGAEAHAFARAAARAEAQAAARDWLVRRIAALLLARAGELHRESQGGGLVGRAGELFARLTGGAFAGLAQLWGEDDRPVLVARRPGGAQVGLAGLSEGTRDQLYLALRLAFLEEHARRAGPLPFVGDDLFQTFDDARAEAGLETLAEVGAGFQVILFTHEESLVELARRRLGRALDLIRL